MKLTITDNGEIWTGVVEGRLDSISAHVVEAEMQPLFDNSDKKLVLDCAGLEYICSSGLRLFLRLVKEVKKNKGELVLKHVNAEIKNIFTITGFIDFFTMDD